MITKGSCVKLNTEKLNANENTVFGNWINTHKDMLLKVTKVQTYSEMPIIVTDENRIDVRFKENEVVLV